MPKNINSLRLERFDAMPAPSFRLQPTFPSQAPHTTLPTQAIRRRRAGKERAPDQTFVDWSENDRVFSQCDHSLRIQPLSDSAPTPSRRASLTPSSGSLKSLAGSHQYLALFRGANFIAQEGGEGLRDYPFDPFHNPPSPTYATTRNPSFNLLRSLTCLAPPPRDLTPSLFAFHPHLERDPAKTSPEDDYKYRLPSYRPLRLASLDISTLEDDYNSFGAVSRLVDPDEFIVHSLELWSQCWRGSGPIPKPSWIHLTSIVFDNCLPLRPDQGDMPESFALPYMSHSLLKQVTVRVTKWDATEESVLEQIGWQVPLRRHGENGEWPVFERFLAQVTGKKRLEKGKKKVLQVIGWEGDELKRNVEERLDMPDEWDGEEEEPDGAKEYDEWDEGEVA